MENTLTFVETLSLEGFKQFVAKDTTIDLLDNGKGLFFSCGSVRGTVAKELDRTKDIKVSKVNDGTKDFWMIHNRSDAGAKVVGTL